MLARRNRPMNDERSGSRRRSDELAEREHTHTAWRSHLGAQRPSTGSPLSLPLPTSFAVTNERKIAKIKKWNENISQKKGKSQPKRQKVPPGFLTDEHVGKMTAARSGEPRARGSWQKGGGAGVTPTGSCGAALSR